MRMAPSRSFHAGMHLIIITYQITEHTLFINSSWRPVAAFQKSNKDKKTRSFYGSWLPHSMLSYHDID